MKRILKSTLFVFLILVSCTNNAPDPDDIALDSWEGIFRQYWSVMNTEYVHFSHDDTDWDEVYAEYLPLFRELDYAKQEDSLEAFRLFKEIAGDLKDYHYNLIVYDNFGNSLYFNPAYEKKYADAVKNGSIMDFPDIYLYDEVEESYSCVSINKPDVPVSEDYLNSVKGYTEIKDMGDKFHNSSSHPFKETIEGGIKVFAFFSEEWKNFLTYLGFDNNNSYFDFDFFFGITEDNVAYFTFSWFALEASQFDIENLRTIAEYNALSEEEKVYVNDAVVKFRSILSAIAEITSTDCCNGSEIKGIVLDLRNNHGGYVSLIQALTGLFYRDCDTLIGYERYKNGYSRYDYTPYFECRTTRFFNEMAAPEKDYERPVALLVNGFSISAAEITCMALKKLPSCHIYGDTTFGATCGLTSREVFHSGPYSSSKLYIYTTTEQFVDSNYKSHECTGITPDTVVKPNKNNDDCFEKAVEWVLGG